LVVVAVGTVHGDKHRFTMQRDTIMEKTMKWAKSRNNNKITNHEINTQLILRDTE